MQKYGIKKKEGKELKENILKEILKNYIEKKKLLLENKGISILLKISKMGKQFLEMN